MLSRAPVVVCLLLVACGGGSAGSPPPKLHAQVATDMSRDVLGALASRPGVRLAVMPLESEGDVAKNTGDLVLEQLATALVKSGAVTIIERAQLQKVIEEMALQQSGLIADEQAIQMGKLAGAQVLLTAKATLVGEAVLVTTRLTDVETGTAVGAFSESVRYDDDLKTAIADRAARQNIRTSPEVLAALGKVKNGDLAEASEVFTPLSQEKGERRSVGLMGLAAVAWAKRDKAQATELCDVSRSESQAPTYCWVIEAAAAYEAGDLAKAIAEATRALNDAGTLVDWQKAEAANLLGLAHAAKKEPDNALAFYEKAESLDPTNTQASSNRARLLEEKGDLATAVAIYQRGLKASPDDKVLALLLRDAEMRLAFQSDKARQAKIASLAGELVQAHAKKSAAKSGDDWTSPPMAVTLLPWTDKGTPAARLGETAFLESTVRNELSGSGVALVDRELLTQVLEELQLNNSALGDSSTALKVGQIVAAKVLVDGSVVRFEGEAQATLKLIDTQSTRVLGSVSTTFDKGAKAGEVARELSAKLAQKLREVSPLRGRVKGTTLNLGARHGVQAGDVFVVKSADGARELGKVSVVNVGEDEAQVRLEGLKSVPADAKAERLAK